MRKKKDIKKQSEDMCQFSFHFFELPEVFITRKKVVEELNVKLHSKSQEREMSRVVVVSGESGTGKSELVRGYGFSERRNNVWDKIMWIDASSCTNLSSSFNELAKRLEIPTEDVKVQRKGIMFIVKKIYKHLLNTKSLFVFDNAKNYEGIEKFLPSSFPDMFSNREKPFILITSCKENWKEEGIEEIKLSDFDQEEADEFVRKTLDEYDSIEELTKNLGCSPLTLTQATTSIKQT